MIATGTPAGVSPMKHGDIVEVEIEGIGVLRNTVNQFEHVFDEQTVSDTLLVVEGLATRNRRQTKSVSDTS